MSDYDAFSSDEAARLLQDRKDSPTVRQVRSHRNSPAGSLGDLRHTPILQHIEHSFHQHDYVPQDVIEEGDNRYQQNDQEEVFNQVAPQNIHYNLPNIYLNDGQVEECRCISRMIFYCTRWMFGHERTCMGIIILLILIFVTFLLGSIVLASIHHKIYLLNKYPNNTDTIYIAPFSIFNYSLDRMPLSYSGVTIEFIQPKGSGKNDKKFEYSGLIQATTSHTRVKSSHTNIYKKIEVRGQSQLVRYWPFDDVTGEIECKENTTVKWVWSDHHASCEKGCGDNHEGYLGSETTCTGDEIISVRDLMDISHSKQDMITIFFTRVKEDNSLDQVNVTFNEKLPDTHHLTFSDLHINTQKNLTISFDNIVEELIRNTPSVLYISTEYVENNHHFEALNIKLTFIERQNIWLFGVIGISISLLMLVIVLVVTVCFLKNKNKEYCTVHCLTDIR